MCRSCTRTRGYNLCLSQRPLKSACPEGLHGHSRYTIFTVSKNVVVVTVPGTPPVGGADGGGAQKASQASEKLPYCHSKCSAGPLVS